MMPTMTSSSISVKPMGRDRFIELSLYKNAALAENDVETGKLNVLEITNG